MKTVAFLVLIASVVTCAQTPASRKPKSDRDKIASALQAGPKFVTQNAALLDWPASPGARVPCSPGWHQWVDLSSGSS
jgi:hypothetical protein